jgi:hypothetical protein
LCAALDDELQRLPESNRLPLLLCYLEGHTQDEAARQLGCPLGTLRSRLQRGRELLRARLARRGLTFSAPLLAAVLAGDGAAAGLPGAQVTALTVAAVRFAARPEAAAGAASPGALALARGASGSGFLGRGVVLTALALAALAAGAALTVWALSGGKP